MQRLKGYYKYMHIFTKEKQSFDFEQIYIAHFSKMKRFAVTYVLSEAEAENIVQDIFLDLWEHRVQMSSHTNLVAHLFTSVKNKCIDYLRHQITATKVEETIQSNYIMELQMKFESLEVFDTVHTDYSEIETILHQAIDSLPDKCRDIFVKSKLEGRKQKEIAEELNISINTVETQMAVAYKRLKLLLKDHYLLWLFLCTQ